jgi:hypothetical protein
MLTRPLLRCLTDLTEDIGLRLAAFKGGALGFWSEDLRLLSRGFAAAGHTVGAIACRCSCQHRRAHASHRGGRGRLNGHARQGIGGPEDPRWPASGRGAGAAGAGARRDVTGTAFGLRARAVLAPGGQAIDG